MIEFWLDGNIKKGTIVNTNEDGTYDIEMMGGDIAKSVEEKYIIE